MSSKKNSSIKKRTGNTAGKVLVRPSAETVSTPSHDQIASRAYALFMNRGGAHGFDMEDWLAAEAELRSGT